jgi:starvation-inducible DNA-binding protein
MAKNRTLSLPKPAQARGTAMSQGREGDRSLHPSPSALPAPARVEIAAALNARLADGLDLYSQLKVAHWNVKGPQFAALHPLFETIAETVTEFNDRVAERAVTLGALARGTARHVARTSQLPEYPQDTTRDLDHVELLAERIETYLAGVREARVTAEHHGDDETFDLLTELGAELEKHGWFLRATLGG